MVAAGVALIAALVTVSSSLSAIAALDVSRVLDGELWRLYSGHLAHLAWRQYVLDVLAFTCLFIACSARFSAAAALLLVFIAAPVVSLTVMAAGFHQVYGGLSGLSAALLSALLVTMIRTEPRRLLPYLLAVLALTGVAAAGGSAGVPVAHEAHAAGILSGIVFALSRWRCRVLLQKI